MPYFKDSEFIEPEALDRGFRLRLERTRQMAGIPMVVSNSLRRRRGKRTSAHQKGDDGIYAGVDIKVRGSRSRYLILNAALRVGCNRIGIYDLHLHLDNAMGKGFDQYVVWFGGKSK